MFLLPRSICCGGQSIVSVCRSSACTFYRIAMFACELYILQHISTAAPQRYNMVDGWIFSPVALPSIVANPFVVRVNFTPANSASHSVRFCDLSPRNWSRVCRLSITESLPPICIMGALRYLARWLVVLRAVPFAPRSVALLCFFSFEILCMFCLTARLASATVMNIHRSCSMFCHCLTCGIAALV